MRSSSAWLHNETKKEKEEKGEKMEVGSGRGRREGGNDGGERGETEDSKKWIWRGRIEKKRRKWGKRKASRKGRERSGG